MSELTDVSNQLSSQNRSLRETLSEEHEKELDRQVDEFIGNKLSEIYTHEHLKIKINFNRLGSSMVIRLVGQIIKKSSFPKTKYGAIYKRREKGLMIIFFDITNNFSKVNGDFFKKGT